MSSFNADKKREHEALAEKALAAGDYAKAFFHTAQAAEFTFNLAEQSEGDVARAYLEDANGLVSIAASLREKAAKGGVRVDKEETGGAEISHRENGGGVCDEARRFAARRWIERRKDQKEGSEEWAKAELVTWDDFERALKTVVPTSRRDAEIVQKNLAFRDSGGSVDDDSDCD